MAIKVQMVEEHEENRAGDPVNEGPDLRRSDPRESKERDGLELWQMTGNSYPYPAEW